MGGLTESQGVTCPHCQPITADIAPHRPENTQSAAVAGDHPVVKTNYIIFAAPRYNLSSTRRCDLPIREHSLEPWSPTPRGLRS